MADYKLQARIPQETADKLFSVMKDLQEVTEVADVTISSITRSALDQLIKNHENEKSNKFIKMEIPIENLNKKQLKQLAEKFSEIGNDFKDIKEVAVAFAKIGLSFMIADTNDFLNTDKEGGK